MKIFIFFPLKGYSKCLLNLTCQSITMKNATLHLKHNIFVVFKQVLCKFYKDGAYTDHTF